MSQIYINTSQNVNISFTAASIGERILAHIIDNIIKAGYFSLYLFIHIKILHLDETMYEWDNWSRYAYLSIVLMPIYLYTLVSESIMEGQTIGKKIMNIKVVKIDGYQPNFGDYLIRWFFRLVDIFLSMGIVSIISMIVSKNNSRLGDIASGTAVISLKNKYNISHTILENLTQDYVPKFPQVIALSDNDMRIIKENYTKALKNEDRQVITRLSNKLKEILKLEIDPKEFTERQFISVIIKDYNFYTGKDN